MNRSNQIFFETIYWNDNFLLPLPRQSMPVAIFHVNILNYREPIERLSWKIYSFVGCGERMTIHSLFELEYRPNDEISEYCRNILLNWLISEWNWRIRRSESIQQGKSHRSRLTFGVDLKRSMKKSTFEWHLTKFMQRKSFELIDGSDCHVLWIN